MKLRPQRCLTWLISSSVASGKLEESGNPPCITSDEMRFPKSWFSWNMKKNDPKNRLTQFWDVPPFDLDISPAEIVKYWHLVLSKRTWFCWKTSSKFLFRIIKKIIYFTFLTTPKRRCTDSEVNRGGNQGFERRVEIANRVNHISREWYRQRPFKAYLG